MNTSDYRVSLILAHAEACRVAASPSQSRTKNKPRLPSGLRDLSDIDLSGADLTGADLSGAILTRAKLIRCKFIFANLTGVDLKFAKLSGADLSSADLTDADLTGTILFRTDLTRATFVNAKFSGATLTSAKLTTANVANSNITIEQRRSCIDSTFCYPEEGVEKVLFLLPAEKEYKERIVAELHSDGKIYIKTALFQY